MTLRTWLAPIAAAALLGNPVGAQARSLVDKLHQFFLTTGFPANPVPNQKSRFVEIVTPVIERLALRGIDFPPTSSSPGFTYRFNFELGVPERSTESFGPVFVERPETVGWRRLDLGVAYLRADLTDFEGAGFGRQIVMQAGQRVSSDLEVRQDFKGQKFSLATHELSLSATYGVTDAWDVNLLQPLVWNSLNLEGVTRASLLRCRGTVCLTGEPVTFVPLRPADFEASAFGPGDTLLRTKYRLSEARLASVAAILTLRLPVGDAKDLHGLGDTTLTPTIIASHAHGPHEVHASLGLELNVDDGERHRAHYALGASLRPFERLAFLLDVVGSSSFTDDTFGVVKGKEHLVFLQSKFGIAELVKSRGTNILAFVPRSDVIDLVLGAKVNPRGSLVGFTGVILPLTNDGLRADVIPSVGLELSF